MQILAILCYIFETLQMASSICIAFMTAILLMILFIMFCFSHLGTLAGMTGCPHTMMEMRVDLPNWSIIPSGCMSTQMNLLQCRHTERMVSLSERWPIAAC